VGETETLENAVASICLDQNATEHHSNPMLLQLWHLLLNPKTKSLASETHLKPPPIQATAPITTAHPQAQ